MKASIKKLKEAIEEGDNEYIHSLYDDLIEQRLLELDPKYLKKLQDLVEGVTFWYA